MYIIMNLNLFKELGYFNKFRSKHCSFGPWLQLIPLVRI